MVGSSVGRAEEVTGQVRLHPAWAQEEQFYQEPPEEEEQHDEDDEPLFRPEVFEARSSEWLGTILLAPKITERLFSYFALLTVAAILGMLFFAEYTRSQKVSGWLSPDLGVVRVLAPSAGVVSNLHVSEGETVSSGTTLATLGKSVNSSAGNTNSQVISKIKARRESILAERTLLARELENRQSSIKTQLRALKAEQQELQKEIALQKQRVDLAASLADRQKRLFSQNMIVQEAVYSAEMSHLDQQSILQSLERQVTGLDRQIVEFEAETLLLPVTIARQEAEMTRQISSLEQDLAVAESERQIEVQAATSGTISTIHADQGSTVDPFAPLLSIIPEGSALEAELFVPSAAVGFIRKGQRVLLKYKAFPYQKFGQHEGVVQSVSRSSLNPAELGNRLVGLSSMLPAGEAVYIVKVALRRSSVQAYGDSIALQPGMQLEADIQVDRRRLYEWVLDPLYTIMGRGT